MVAQRGSTANDTFVESLDKTASVRPEPRPADWRAVEELLGLLARAVHHLHTYPPTSSLCTGAIDACTRALAALESRDQLVVRVTPSELTVDNVATGRGTQVGQELARRLHKASVASVAFERAASAREIGRFCQDLVRCSEKGSQLSLLELLTEHGVDKVVVEMSTRPQVIEVPPPAPEVSHEQARERGRFEASLSKGGVVHHLYPPQRGWVRVEPGAGSRPMSLLELAVAAGDPGTLASMLLRLTDDAADVSPAEALDRKYSDVAMLISSLDPETARRMFGLLARAVLDLEPGTRQALLRRAVLPGLLDGQVDGAILREFPDVDLAESLCLLLDLEAAAPELLNTALARLDLSSERKAALMPLLDGQLQQREEDAPESGRQATLARHARELMRVDAGGAKSFADFSAFDLSIDDATLATLHDIRSSVPSSDLLDGQLSCLWHLICLEPNPDAVARFLARSFTLIHELERAARFAEVPVWISNYRRLAEGVRESRPDVADAITVQLGTFCTIERASWLVDIWRREPEGRQSADAMIAAIGASVGAPLLELLERETTAGSAGQERAKALTSLMTEHAALVAPIIPSALEKKTPAVRRMLLRILGAAGPGYEPVLAAHVKAGDELVAREALRALARLGTPEAAGLVTATILEGRGALSAAAEETLWHFPRDEAERRTRELLARRDFPLSRPDAAGRLLDRAARAGAADLDAVLTGLAPLRFRIWNPAVARMARKAHTMLKR